MKTILIVGASGYIGSNLVHHFKKKYKVVAAFNKHVLRFDGASHVKYDFGGRDYMKRLLLLIRPDIILYCAGITDLKECVKRPRVADLVNSFGPVVLSGAADTVAHRFIYLSSAYVFDGKKGNFNENDTVLPESGFGKSKLAGENYVRTKCMTWTILRMSPLVGMGNVYHLSTFDQMRIKLERGERVELPKEEVHSFLSLDVAIQALDWLCVNESKNAVYNLGGLTKLSWYDFGKAFATSLGLDSNLIVPAPNQFEGHVDFSLNGSELVKQLQINPLILEECLDLFKQQLIR